MLDWRTLYQWREQQYEAKLRASGERLRQRTAAESSGRDSRSIQVPPLTHTCNRGNSSPITRFLCLSDLCSLLAEIQDRYGVLIALWTVLCQTGAYGATHTFPPSMPPFDRDTIRAGQVMHLQMAQARSELSSDRLLMSCNIINAETSSTLKHATLPSMSSGTGLSACAGAERYAQAPACPERLPPEFGPAQSGA